LKQATCLLISFRVFCVFRGYLPPDDPAHPT
jgi:hypothetical protein